MMELRELTLTLESGIPLHAAHFRALGNIADELDVEVSWDK
jgi:hypothetical protein